jgi:hypothetical protein
MEIEDMTLPSLPGHSPSKRSLSTDSKDKEGFVATFKEVKKRTFTIADSAKRREFAVNLKSTGKISAKLIEKLASFGFKKVIEDQAMDREYSDIQSDDAMFLRGKSGDILVDLYDNKVWMTYYLTDGSFRAIGLRCGLAQLGGRR